MDLSVSCQYPIKVTYLWYDGETYRCRMVFELAMMGRDGGLAVEFGIGGS